MPESFLNPPDRPPLFQWSSSPVFRVTSHAAEIRRRSTAAQSARVSTTAPTLPAPRSPSTSSAVAGRRSTNARNLPSSLTKGPKGQTSRDKFPSGSEPRRQDRSASAHGDPRIRTQAERHGLRPEGICASEPELRTPGRSRGRAERLRPTDPPGPGACGGKSGLSPGLPANRPGRPTADVHRCWIPRSSRRGQTRREAARYGPLSRRAVSRSPEGRLRPARRALTPRATVRDRSRR